MSGHSKTGSDSPDDMTEARIGGREHRVRKAKVCSGIEIKPVYRPEDVAGLDYDRDLGDPGEYPFTRGIHPTMFRRKLWTFRQYSGFGTAEDTNSRFRFLIQNGQTGLSIALDLPTQLGLDSDDPRATGEVGRVGVAIDTLDDMERIMEGIDLRRISTSVTMNALSGVMLAMYIAIGEKQGVPMADLRGTMQNDILKEFAARGTFVFPVIPAIKMTGDLIEFCARNMPKYNAISVTSSHTRSAGLDCGMSTAVQFKNADVYVREVMRRGLSFDAFASNFSFLFGGDMEFFESICKMRAARRLWAKIARDEYGAKTPSSMMMRCAGGGAMSQDLTRAMPITNVARLTLSALSQVLGGSQSITIPSYDDAFATPTQESARTSLMIEAIIAYESGVPDVVDPLAGSYFVEWLTNEMEKRIREDMELIDAWGGPVKAVESGRLQSEIARQAYEHEKKIQSGKKLRVGVNVFNEDDGGEQKLDVFEIDPNTQLRQLERLQAVRARRDAAAVKGTLVRLRGAARENKDNLVPYFIDAVRSYATIGEITATLKTIYGEFVEPSL
ncbi:MAG: methylmalonyl-CoA mutase family protein [Dehalococcoidia bacterium]|nr:methylmalonyl-CoA mutase family protein [Dehalococcoidia bacterium]